MISLEKRNAWYRIVFRMDGVKTSRFLNTQSKCLAEACLAKIRDSLYRYELGLVPVGKRKVQSLERKKRWHLSLAPFL